MTMSKKLQQAESIKQHRETDAQRLRDNYLAVIQLHTAPDGSLTGTHQEIRNYLKACSDLAKLQHLLQKEKDDGKGKDKEESPLTKEDNKKLDTLLKETLGDKWTGLKKDI